MPESVRRTVSLSFALSVLFLPWPVHAHALGLASSLPTGEQSSATLTSTPGQIMLATICSAQSFHKWLSACDGVVRDGSARSALGEYAI